MFLEPNSQFLIEQKLPSPSLTGPYYVQAIVKNSISGATLATINLTDDGTHRYFSSLWTVPALEGVQISIFKTVYDDAAHTTEDPAYGTTLESHIIKHVATQLLGGFTRGGEVDYDRIERMISNHIERLPKPERVSFPDIPDAYDDTELRGRLDDYQSETARARTEIVEYVRNLLDDHRKGSERLIKAQIDALRSFIADFKQQMGNDATVKADALLERFTALQGFITEQGERQEDAHDKRHNELLEKMERPVLLKVLPENVKREEKKESEPPDENEQRAMTVKELLNLIK